MGCCSLPPPVKPHGSKLVFTTKFRSDGSIDYYKDRLVVLKNKLEFGLNYGDLCSYSQGDYCARYSYNCYI